MCLMNFIKLKANTIGSLVLIALMLLPVFSVASASDLLFTETLNLGSRSDEVSLLQDCLRDLGYFDTETETTDYYGSITETAVQSFQSDNSIVSSGDPYTTGYGQVGPETRKELNSQCSSGGSPSAVSPVSVTSCASPVNDRTEGYVHSRYYNYFFADCI